MELHEIQTPAGVFEVRCTERGVVRVSFPARPRRLPCAVTRLNRFREGFVRRFSDELAGYFRGERIVFETPIDLGSVGSFDRRVLALLRSIPYGEVRSYGWVAGKIGIPGGARAVGGACRRNPCPILIPCHRVIEAGGGLGGFSGGMAWKRYLLDLEKKNKKNV